LRHLQWRDIDSEQQRILVRGKKGGSPETNQEQVCFVSSTLLLNGTPIHVVKEILRHSTIRTTEF
jgi:integrase